MVIERQNLTSLHFVEKHCRLLVKNTLGKIEGGRIIEVGKYIEK